MCRYPGLITMISVRFLFHTYQILACLITSMVVEFKYLDLFML